MKKKLSRKLKLGKIVVANMGKTTAGAKEPTTSIFWLTKIEC
ncbi:hypothetical protein CLV51_106161 [Chitinophaga niastensis]|uniref:Uncharacterized protein n=1 Tax=Chitinophaga niastensis TaxID=536980 RepID=A0A2P8HDI0_CHINA|nr:hypothetical protein [Chitinophaga niastensis]PSL44295.1 hypothetical protein CLV51_106161 [Chitinophaga niastensis]